MAMDALQSRMSDQGLMKPPLIMQSSRGLAEPTTHKSVSILMSGPVGGTSFDVGLVVDGEPVITNTTLVDRRIIGNWTSVRESAVVHEQERKAVEGGEQCS